jgi:hypothetical protein
MNTNTTGNAGIKETTHMNTTSTTTKESTDMNTKTDQHRFDDRPVSVHQFEHTVRYLQDFIATDKAMTNDADNAVSTSFTFPGNGTWGFALGDLIYNTAGQWMATEINGPNGAGTSVHGADLPRVRHEVATLLNRNGRPALGSVILRAWSPDTNSQPEIAVRGALFAAELHEATNLKVLYKPASHHPDPDAINVIYGNIPALVEGLALTDGTLTWHGQPVAMVFNQNLLSELARRSGLTLDQLTDQIDPNITHAGTAMDQLFNNKPAQQDLFDKRNAIAPVPYKLVNGITEAAEKAVAMARAHHGAFIKPSGVSGGTGAIPVDPTNTIAEILDQLQTAGDKLAAKYGPNWETTCPWAIYAFIHAQPVTIDANQHRWDLRFAIAATPDTITVTPLEARICPGVVDTTISAGNAVSNMTGRQAGTVPTFTATELAEAAGLPADALHDAATGLAAWYRNATTN